MFSFLQFMLMGYPRERILQAFREIAEPSNRDISSLWPSVLCRLPEDEVYGFSLKSQSAREDCHTTATTNETNGKSLFYMLFDDAMIPPCATYQTI